MVIEARTRRARGPVECTEVSPRVRLVVLQKKLQGRQSGSRRSGHGSVLGQAFWAGQYVCCSLIAFCREAVVAAAQARLMEMVARHDLGKTQWFHS